MFKFFTQKKWFLWSIGGTLVILLATWYQVQLDVRINEWFGEFYDTLQKALTEPNSVTEKEFIAYLFTFAKIAAVYILVVILVIILQVIGHSDGELQWLIIIMIIGMMLHQLKEHHKVQEDTLKFARIMEGLGAELLRSLMTLIAFHSNIMGFV